MGIIHSLRVISTDIKDGDAVSGLIVVDPKLRKDRASAQPIAITRVLIFGWKWVIAGARACIVFLPNRRSCMLRVFIVVPGRNEKQDYWRCL